ALEEFWKTNSIGRPLSEYFGMYVLANAKTVDHVSSAFYGVFVHSKLIAIDYDTEGAEAIVGSANLNDRSLLGDRDAEVSVAVKGPFVKAMVSKLIDAHTESSTSLPNSADLQPSLSVVAETNAERLQQISIQWSQGTVQNRKLLDQNSNPRPNSFGNEPEHLPELDVSEAFMVGAGVHWKILPGHMVKGLKGHLLPWNMALWGDADVYRSWKHYHPTGAWLQVS
ncbi:PLDZETA1, partial [Symbiodinium sp. CCMP2456]